MYNDCIFCKIANKEIEANVIYENQLLICFLDAEPINEGHILIIPKKHYLDADELPDEIAIEIMRISQKILKTLKLVYELQGYSIMQNGGIFNDVGHYHMHIFPRYKNDGFGWTFDETILHAFDNKISTKIREVMDDHKDF